MGAGAVGNIVGGVHVPGEHYLITGDGGPRKTQKAIR